ncbi:MAG: hypothetical protein U0936_09615 [Planctomycetaceae bacterium]
MEPYVSMCSNAGDTRSGGGDVGDGKFGIVLLIRMNDATAMPIRQFVGLSHEIRAPAALRQSESVMTMTTSAHRTY